MMAEKTPALNQFRVRSAGTAVPSCRWGISNVTVSVRNHKKRHGPRTIQETARTAERDCKLCCENRTRTASDTTRAKFKVTYRC